MEETLGKRIVHNRKCLGMTQDQLAEKLGVTAQAVSKWENDQSCPDITMLPRLAEIFGITTDALLGVHREQEVRIAEVVTEAESEPEAVHINNTAGNWEVQWDGGRKNGIGMALWVLLTGGLLLASNILGWDAALWSIIWPSGLLVFGLFGLFPKFSFFRLGCGLLGAYFLLTNLGIGIFAQGTLGKEYILPVFLLLFGLSLLVDALRKNKKPSFQVFHNGERIYKKDGKEKQIHYSAEGEAFRCSVSFGNDRKQVHLPRLSCGTAEVSFGELEIDLSECAEIADGCHVTADCSFGELTVYVPRSIRVEHTTSTAFGSVEIFGQPSADAEGVLHMDCSANFGQIQIRYI